MKSRQWWSQFGSPFPAIRLNRMDLSPLVAFLLWGWCIALAYPQCAAAQASASGQSPEKDSSTSPVKANNSSIPVRSCLTVAEAAATVDRDVCVEAHVCQVVESADGNRFLDACPESQSDDECRFAITSPYRDQGDVGDLRRFQGKDVHIRGVIRLMNGRMGIVLSHARQLDGGSEKFRPNPRLQKSFNGESGRLPVHDPNLNGSGRHRAFMNTSDRQQLQHTSMP